MTEKPLTGVRVLDFTRFYAGPFCAMLLGDLGADVVKIEQPKGDPIREQGPPFHKGHGLSFLAVNRNKRSVTLDLKSDEGLALARDLALQADVVVENFRSGVMDRLGLAYEWLRQENPGVVYASISGLGADGPLKNKGAFDLTAQAIGGYMSITGERDGAPVKLGTSAFDLVAGLNAMSGILAALYKRGLTGEGQKIETSLLEGQVGFLVEAGLEYLIAGTVRQKWGSQHANLVPYKAFQTSDGWLVIGAGTQRLFTSFVEILGMPQLLTDPKYGSERARVEHRDEIYAILDAEVLKYSTVALADKLDERGVPCAEVNSMDKVFTNEQILHRKMIRKVTHHEYGEISLIGPSVKYSNFEISEDWTAPPTLGEHNDEVIFDWLRDARRTTA